MAALNYWLWLTTRRGVGQRGVLRVLEYFGTPERVYFAQQEDLEIIMDEPFRPFDNLTAGHHRAADVLRRHSGVRQKRHHGLFQCSEIAVPAFRTFAAACDPPGFHRFGPLIGHMFYFSVFRHNDGFERRGTDVDSQIVFLLCHIFRSCIANYKNF